MSGSQLEGPNGNDCTIVFYGVDNVGKSVQFSERFRCNFYFDFGAVGILNFVLLGLFLVLFGNWLQNVVVLT